MNHQPFEDWLIENQSLTSQQSKDLDEHLNKLFILFSACPG